jgi:hypothetical protein
LSQVLGLSDSSYRIGVRREIGPKNREKRRICKPFGNSRQPRRRKLAALDETGSSWPVLRDSQDSQETEDGAEHWGDVGLMTGNLESGILVFPVDFGSSRLHEPDRLGDRQALQDTNLQSVAGEGQVSVAPGRIEGHSATNSHQPHCGATTGGPQSSLTGRGIEVAALCLLKGGSDDVR